MRWGNFIDRHLVKICAIVFILALILFNSCSPLPIRRDNLLDFDKVKKERDLAPLPVYIYHKIPAKY